MKKLWLLLIILILLNMSVYLIVLGWDIVSIFSNPAAFQQTIPKLGRDAGELLLKSQSTISASLEELKTNADMSVLQRQFLNNQVFGSVALNLMLVFGLTAVFGFFFRKKDVSFRTWFKIFLASVVIVGAVMVLVSFILHGKVQFPYQGFYDLATNFGVFFDSLMKCVPAL